MTGAPDFDGNRIARRLLLSYLWLWLLEGALRKWVLPALQQPLYFVRVIVVIAAIGYALSRLRRPWPWGAHVGIGFVVAVTLFTAAHVISGAQTLTQAVLGTRLWLELVLTPLALGPLLARRDVLRAAHHIALASFPIAAIALLQVISPATAPINKLFEADGSDNFGNEGGVVRATSLFTSSAGHSAFIVLAGAAVLMTLLSAEATARGRRVALACLPVILLMAITSGSRSAIFGLVVIVSVAVPTLVRGGGKDAVRVGLLVGTALALALWLGPRLAPDAIAGVMARFAGEGTVAEPKGRVVGSLLGWMQQVSGAPTWGRGLGSTAQGLRNLGSAAQAETELDQWVVQLGPAIFVFALALRTIALVYLVGRVLSAVRRGVKETAPFLAVIVIFWASGPITSQGSINGVGVLAALLLVGVANARDSLAESCVSGEMAKDPVADPERVLVAPSLVGRGETTV